MIYYLGLPWWVLFRIPCSHFVQPLANIRSQKLPLVYRREKMAKVTSSATLPNGLRELLDKCNAHGADIRVQLQEEHNNASRNSDSCDEFFLHRRGATTASTLSSEQPLTLHPHQVDGIRWMMSLFKNGVNGVLADDMGLGKTVQVIAFLSALYGQRYFGTHLIVVPLSTLDNWKQEFHKWCPWLPLVVFHGIKEQRAHLRDWLRARYRNSWKHQANIAKRSAQGEAVESLVKEVGCVVLTTYDMAMADCAILCRLIPWDVLVVDEAHRLKNFNCKLLHCLRKCQTEGRLLLTGTPLQNNVKELWSMLNFVLPQLFDNVDSFQSWFDQAEHVSDCLAAGVAPTQEDDGTGGDGVDDPFGKQHAGNDAAEAEHLSISGLAVQSLRQALTLAQLPMKADTNGSGSNGTAGPRGCLLPTLRSNFQEEVQSLSCPASSSLRLSPPTITEVSAAVQRMHEALRPFILRRTKKEIVDLNLPKKVEVVVYTALLPDQMRLYEMVKASEAFSNNRLMQLRKVCCHPSLFSDAQLVKAAASVSSSRAVLSSQAAGHRAPVANAVPSSSMTESNGEGVEGAGGNQEEAAADVVARLCSCGSNNHSKKQPQQGQRGSATTTPFARLNHLLRGSAKFSALDKMLRLLLVSRSNREGSSDSKIAAAADKGHKVLIFSQMTKVLDLIEDYFELLREIATTTAAAIPHGRNSTGGGDERGEDKSFVVPYVRLDGTSTRDERVASIDSFNRKRNRVELLGSTIGSPLHPSAATIIGNSDGVEDDNVVFCGVQRTPPMAQHNYRERNVTPPLAPQRNNFFSGVSSSDPTAMQKRIDYTNSENHEEVKSDNDNEEEPLVFLISTRSGGVGLNLVAADTVILFDCDFNPHNDQQAIDRCHRIGQTRPVAVYRMVAPSTVEEALMYVALRKKRLEKVVIECGRFGGAGGGGRSAQEKEGRHVDNDYESVVGTKEATRGDDVFGASSSASSSRRLSRFLFDASNGDLDRDLGIFQSVSNDLSRDRPSSPSSSSTSRLVEQLPQDETLLLQALTMQMTFGASSSVHAGTSDAELASLMERDQVMQLLEL
jgi:SNF2 family DNA or RNA helicase